MDIKTVGKLKLVGNNLTGNQRMNFSEHLQSEERASCNINRTSVMNSGSVSSGLHIRDVSSSSHLMLTDDLILTFWSGSHLFGSNYSIQPSAIS